MTRKRAISLKQANKKFMVFCIQQYAFYDNNMYTLSTLDLSLYPKKFGIYIIHEL